jgi:hypothetical protein
MEKFIHLFNGLNLTSLVMSHPVYCSAEIFSMTNNAASLSAAKKSLITMTRGASVPNQNLKGSLKNLLGTKTLSYFIIESLVTNKLCSIEMTTPTKDSTSSQAASGMAS